jgi:hypothetical protein
MHKHFLFTHGYTYFDYKKVSQTVVSVDVSFFDDLFVDERARFGCLRYLFASLFKLGQDNGALSLRAT